MKVISSALLVALILLIGCRAKPAPDAGFLEQPAMMSINDKKAVFQRTYRDPNTDFDKFTELQVAPVNMHYMMTQNFWEKANEANVSKEQVQKSADQIAQY